MLLPSTLTRPELPKRMAARLRAVYAKVDDARSYVAFAEAKLLDFTMHLDEYQRDPAMFALLRYPSTSGADSYAVQTNIARTQDEIEHKTERMPIYVQAAADAEQAMASIEREVLEALAALRPNTHGRVAWPKEPRSLEDYRKESLAQFKRERKTSHQWIIKTHEKRQAEIAHRKLKEKEYQSETERLIEKTLATMSKEKAAAYQSVFDALKQAMSSGQFEIQKMIAIADGDRGAFAPIIESAKQFWQAKMSSECTVPNCRPPHHSTGPA